MKECIISVKKVYESKRCRTTTEHVVTLSEEALEELCALVIEHVDSVDISSLNLLYQSLREF